MVKITHKQVYLKIPQHKLNKLLEGQTIQLASHELGDEEDDEYGDFDVEKSLHTKIRKARQTGKGVRIQGGKLTLKKFGSFIADGAQTVKKIIPKKVAADLAGKAGMMAGAYGASMVGMNPEMGSMIGQQIGKSTVNAGYSANFNDKNGLQKFGTTLGTDLAVNGLNSAIQYGTSSGGSLDHVVLHNSRGIQGRVYKNGNPLLKNIRSNDSIYNQGQSVKTTRGKLPKQQQEVIQSGGYITHQPMYYSQYHHGGSFVANGSRL